MFAPPPEELVPGVEVEKVLPFGFDIVNLNLSDLGSAIE